MDITKEKDANKLKALAYDNLMDAQRAQNNLQAIEQRLQQLQAEEAQNSQQKDTSKKQKD